MKQIKCWKSDDGLKISENVDEIGVYEQDCKRKEEISKYVNSKISTNEQGIGNKSRSDITDFLLNFENVTKVVDIYNATQYKPEDLEKTY